MARPLVRLSLFACLDLHASAGLQEPADLSPEMAPMFCRSQMPQSDPMFLSVYTDPRLLSISHTHMFGCGLDVQEVMRHAEQRMCVRSTGSISVDSEPTLEKLNYHQLPTFLHSTSDPHQIPGWIFPLYLVAHK